MAGSGKSRLLAKTVRGTGVGVGVGVSVGVGVPAGEAVALAVAVRRRGVAADLEEVGLDVGVAVDVAVGEGVYVEVGVAVGVYVAVAVGVGEGVSVGVAVPNMATVGGRFRAARVIRPTNNAITLAIVKRRRLLANPGPCRFFNIKRISYRSITKYREGEYTRLLEAP